MWYLKLRTGPEHTTICEIAKKYRVSLSGYPINHRVNDGCILLTVAGFVSGPAENVREFIKSGKREFIRLEVNKNFLIGQIRMPSYLAVLYSPQIIFVEPARYDPDGVETIELACWDRKPLEEIVTRYKAHYNAKVLCFHRRKICNISILGMNPEITDKQKIALSLAIREGYYRFPRGTTLKRLAGLMKVSFSTFQAHLCKAEANLIPNLFKQ